MKILGFVLIALVVLVGAFGIAVVFGGRAWNLSTERMARRIVAAGGANGKQAIGSFEPELLAGLPAPVARYFQFALTLGQPLIRTARVEHAGEFRASVDAAWAPFTSVQHFCADPPGFVWDARIAMIPIMGVRVRDSYFAGEASMLGKILALVPVVHEAGGPELASSALHRYLAESAWLPTALLPRDGLQWEAVNGSTARVTLRDSGVEVSLDVHFAASGAIERVEADRYRDVNGEAVLTPFVGRFRAYGEVDGMRIPLEAEVEWLLPAGPLSYWRGRITDIAYEF